MKNFLDLQAIDYTYSVLVTVSPIYQNGFPDCWIKINKHIWIFDQLSQQKTCQVFSAINDNLYIEIGMKNKRYHSDLETAVEITSVKIDDFDIIPNFVHHANYNNERKLNTPTKYLGFNGVWTFEIQQPFYQWKHQATGQGSVFPLI